MSRPEPRRSPRPEPARTAEWARHELAMALRAAYLTMPRRANAALGRLKLTADQRVLLTSLVVERRRLVARERNAGDGRALRVSLTASGRRLRRRVWQGAAATFCGALAGLVPADEVGALIGHLSGIAGGMHASGSPPDRDAGTAPPGGYGEEPPTAEAENRGKESPSPNVARSRADSSCQLRLAA